MAIVFYFSNMALQGKKILLGVTGSIAAYKSILLVRLLVKAGAEVKVVITDAAKDFVSPLVLSTLSKNKVSGNLFEGDAWANHVMLGRWADMMVIAPLSCNTLAKMANGQCDNLLLAAYLSATCPVMVCPAMDEDMWHHATTKRNIEQLRKDGVKIVPVGFGELGSGLTGDGRMAEPGEIMTVIEAGLVYPGMPLKGKQALVTAGPTYEPIDPVRFIGNHSSGKMGIAIANQLHRAGARVSLVLGPSSLRADPGIETIHVQTAKEMYAATLSLFAQSDIAVFSAAVADFRPAEVYSEKWKKDKEATLPAISLIENPDILKHCGTNKRPGQIVVGFALETEDEEKNALKKLKAKNATIMVLNSLREQGAGFGGDTNKITIFEESGNKIEWPLQSKDDAALQIVHSVINHIK
jgi:phosphopantothenoylcysteine decarboxylase / phosphopantothenate---cysteine ligase